MEGVYYYDYDDLKDSDDSDESDNRDYDVDALWIIINELCNVMDEEFEDKLRRVLRRFTVAEIRRLCWRLPIRKVSKLRKHELINAVISWGKKQKGRFINRVTSYWTAKELGFCMKDPVDVDKLIEEILEARKFSFKIKCKL